MTYEEDREKLVELLKNKGRIKTTKVENAFLKTPREQFLSEKNKKYAYIDNPLEIGNKQTISAPHMVAIMCEELNIQPAQKILEIGTGSGYHAAVVSQIIGQKGHVYTIETIPTLKNFAETNIKNTDITNITVILGDGSEGLPKHAPYDRIYVTCTAPDIPQPLINQLKNNGKMIIPVGKRIAELILIEKKQKQIFTKNICGCVFVPLVGKHGF